MTWRYFLNMCIILPKQFGIQIVKIVVLHNIIDHSIQSLASPIHFFLTKKNSKSAKIMSLTLRTLRTSLFYSSLTPVGGPVFSSQKIGPVLKMWRAPLAHPKNSKPRHQCLTIHSPDSEPKTSSLSLWLSS